MEFLGAVRHAPWEIGYVRCDDGHRGNARPRTSACALALGGGAPSEGRQSCSKGKDPGKKITPILHEFSLSAKRIGIETRGLEGNARRTELCREAMSAGTGNRSLDA